MSLSQGRLEEARRFYRRALRLARGRRALRRPGAGALAVGEREEAEGLRKAIAAGQDNERVRRLGARLAGEELADDKSGESIWRIWVDTGGTFTDCLAVDPEGRAPPGEGAVDGASAAGSWSRPVTLTLRVGLALPPVSSAASPAASGRRRSPRRSPASDPAGALPWPARLRAGRGRPSSCVARGGAGAGRPAGDRDPARATCPSSASPPPVAPTRCSSARGPRPPSSSPAASPTSRDRRPAAARPLRPGDRTPRPLYRAVVEVAERLAADGSVLEPLDLGGVRAAARRLLAEGSSPRRWP